VGGRILMVAYHYPPSGGVAAQRPAAFARHLPAFGWEPCVVSRTPDPRQPLDPRQPAAPEPALRLAPIEFSRGLGLLPRSWIDPWRRFLCVPDEESGWRRLLARRLPRLIEERKPDVLWANSVPPGTLVAAAEAAVAAGIPFVADFHNEWTRNLYYRPPTRWHDARHRALERRVIESARRVVTLNPMHTEDLNERFPGCRAETIENGFEPETFSVPPPDPGRRPLVFTYAGAIYGHQGPRPFLEALAESGIREAEVRVVGDRFGAFDPGSWPFPVRVEGHLSHDALGRVFAESSAFFLCLEGPAARQLPAKLYEYLHGGRPTFAIVPRDGAAERWLRRTGAGSAVAFEDRSAWAPALRAFVEEIPAWKAPDASAFHRRRQAGDLARLLDEVRR
jgi:hypothetical protein